MKNKGPVAADRADGFDRGLARSDAIKSAARQAFRLKRPSPALIARGTKFLMPSSRRPRWQ
jgi:hypothetical protein